LEQERKIKQLISDKAFKNGSELILFQPKKLNKKQQIEKTQELEQLKTILLFGDITKKEYEYKIDYYNYHIMLKCPFCDKVISDRGFSRHLKNHDIIKEQFLNEYGGTSAIEMVANKIMQWYSPNRNKWAFQNNDELLPYIYQTTEKQLEKIRRQNEENKTKKYIPIILNLNTIKGHINRNHTISIEPWGDCAGWICFDVDTGEDALNDAIKIVNTMVKYGITRKDILVTFSGNKGYHVELFFQYPITYKQIQKLGNKICFLAGSSINKKHKTNKIEIRPESNRGIKLGLGINQKTGKKTRIFLNEKNNYFEHEYLDYIYFLNMDKISNNLIGEILRSTDQPEKELKEINPSQNSDTPIEVEKQQQNVSNFDDQEIDDEDYIEYRFAPSLDFKIKVIEKKFNNGLNNKDTHHYWSFQIALWMRDILEWDKDRAEEELNAWTENNKEYVKNINASLYDAKHIIISVYDKDVKKKYSLEKGLKAKSLLFYPHEIRLAKKVLRQAKKERRLNSNAPSLLYFTFICLSKYYGSNPFYASVNNLMKYSTLANKTYMNWFNWLSDKGYVEQIKRGSSYTNKASEYFVPCIVPISTSIGNNTIISINKELDIIDIYNRLIK